jgi:arylsulfatase A-like enzyme
MQGRSLLPLLRGEAPSARDAVFAQMTWHGGEYDPMRCIRTGSHKYIRNFQPGWPVQIGGAYTQRYGEPFMVRHFARPRPDEELYDLAVDPWEAQNLAGRPELRDLQTELARRLTAWMDAVADPLLLGPVPFPDPARTGSGCVWVKAPPHDPAAEPFRWDVLRTRDFGELPLPEPNDA